MIAEDVRQSVDVQRRLLLHARRCPEGDRLVARRLARHAGALVVLRRTPPLRETPQPLAFGRFDPGARLWTDLTSAVETAIRAEQARFSHYAVMHSIVALTAAQRTRDTDLLAGYQPDLDPSGILPVQATVYEEAGQNALGLLGIEGAFGIRGDTELASRVSALFTDQLPGINATTRRQLQAILDRYAGADPDVIAAAVQDYWDWAAEVRGLLIARTEVSRTSAGAEVDTFGRNGIDTLVFSGDTSDDRPGDGDCNDYLDVEYSVDEADGIIPVHGNCTHYWLPKFPDGWEVPATPWLGGAVTSIATLLGAS